ncbi:hypothetical protein LSM04_005641 [Trypanosoma melophagium]|uniref:uncharacterized protein n=1 Tax=Trypanosoma melophagium TaxID=715481 RepID=UPI00351A8A89|nr:hypothetical protein LSM04_005641 [Trypanosoma melophagium]
METRLAFLVKQEYASNQANTLMQLLQNDLGVPVTTVAEDFPPIFALLPCEESDISMDEAAMCLCVPTGRFSYGEVGNESLGLHYTMCCKMEETTISLNPFLSADITQPEALPLDVNQGLNYFLQMMLMEFSLYLLLI